MKRAMTKIYEVSVDVNGNRYDAAVEQGKVWISEDGVMVGSGEVYHTPQGSQIECDAVLGDDVYEALEAAITAALRPKEVDRG